MTIELIGHTLQYEVESVCDVFFPGFRSNTKDIKIISRYSLNEKASCNTTIIYENNSFSADVCTEKLDFYNKKMLVKQALYKACIEFLSITPPWGIITGIRPSKIAVSLIDNGKSDIEISKILKEEYFVNNKNIENTIKCANYTLNARALMNESSVSLYIAIPYCPSRCNYCSFVSTSIENELALIPEYLDDLYKELASVKKLVLDKKLSIITIYIGGGTPTILSANQLEMLVAKIHDLFDLNSIKEFTIEAGRPDTITKEKLVAIKKIVTPRISINPQTLNDKVLETIGRRHTSDEFLKSFSLARSLGFENINVDVIAGLTSDTLASFKHTIDAIYSMSPENITIHSLAIKRNSNISLSENVDYSPNEIANEMIEYADKILDKYEPYYMYKQRNTINNLENIGYTLKGKQCLYNIYMMNEMHTVLGVGASAVTKVVTKATGKIHRVANYKLPMEYIRNFKKSTGERIQKLYEYELK